jgi:hypothetical protein
MYLHENRRDVSIKKYRIEDWDGERTERSWKTKTKRRQAGGIRFVPWEHQIRRLPNLMPMVVEMLIWTGIMETMKMEWIRCLK